MNQDKIKELLLQIEDTKEDFCVIFTGKSSKKVNGFYRPAEKTIYLHTKNFQNDSQLLYTAIHEYAHHLQCEIYGNLISSKCHTNAFRTIFTKLLFKAEEKKILVLPFNEDEEINKWTKILKDKYVKINSQIMVDFGKDLYKVYELCSEKKINFYDYALIKLGMEKSIVNSIISVSQTSSVIDENVELGFEELKVISKIKDVDVKKTAIESLTSGEPLVLVKSELNPEKSTNPFSSDIKTISIEEKLLEEKKRILRTIDNLEKRVSEINLKLGEI